MCTFGRSVTLLTLNKPCFGLYQPLAAHVWPGMTDWQLRCVHTNKHTPLQHMHTHPHKGTAEPFLIRRSKNRWQDQHNPTNIDTHHTDAISTLPWFKCFVPVSEAEENSRTAEGNGEKTVWKMKAGRGQTGLQHWPPAPWTEQLRRVGAISIYNNLTYLTAKLRRHLAFKTGNVGSTNTATRKNLIVLRIQYSGGWRAAWVRTSAIQTDQSWGSSPDARLRTQTEVKHTRHTRAQKEREGFSPLKWTREAWRPALGQHRGKCETHISAEHNKRKPRLGHVRRL